ncbi:MAG: polysaccharide pyruvyl transferase family protein [Puniceicoccaceae bacterium]
MLYYHRNDNFGDALNGWLWARLAPEFERESQDRLILGIGTILSKNVPKRPLKEVFGAGWSGGNKPTICPKWRFWCVRGPHTADGLGLDRTLAVTDPGVLVKLCVGGPEADADRVGFMPHHRSMEAADWEVLCREIGLTCIDPRLPVGTVLRELRRCRLVITEAMHGAIVSDALGIPWIPVALYPWFNAFKWRDWTDSLGIEGTPVKLCPIFHSGPKRSKLVLNLMKRGSVKVNLGKDGWRSLPLRTTSPEDQKKTLLKLRHLVCNRTAVLSCRDRLGESIAELEKRLEKVREVCAAGEN